MLRDVLQDDYGIDLRAWDLMTARGISDDGLTIVGAGRGPRGGTEAWVVHLPEPMGFVVAILVTLAAPRARRRSVVRR